MIAPEPITRAGRWKRDKAAELAEITGFTFCMCCRKLRPSAQVKLYKGMQRGTVARCDGCQKKRRKAMLLLPSRF